jgi:hypothetical protein
VTEQTAFPARVYTPGPWEDPKHPLHQVFLHASGFSPKIHCNDDHSNAVVGSSDWCPMHGYDASVPAPLGKVWVPLVRDNGQIFTVAMPDPGHWKGPKKDRYREIQVKPDTEDEPAPKRPWWRP